MSSNGRIGRTALEPKSNRSCNHRLTTLHPTTVTPDETTDTDTVITPLKVTQGHMYRNYQLPTTYRTISDS